MTGARLVPFDPRDGVPWAPESLTNLGLDGRTLATNWRYVLVEELVGPIALLARWRWPLADGFGSVFWSADTEEPELTATIPRGLLATQLYEPNQMRRDPRAGDTFAVEGAQRTGWGGRRPVADLRRLMPMRILDISADTHELARLAYLSAAGAVQPSTLAEEDEQIRAALSEAAEQRAQHRAPQLEVAAPPAPQPASAGRG